MTNPTTRTTILTELLDLRRQEATTSDLQPIENDLLTRARDRLRKIRLTLQEQDGNPETLTRLSEEGGAIQEALREVTWARAEKIIGHAKYSPHLSTRMEKLLPHESKLYQDVKIAVGVYREAVR
ncbi:MAG: hypothetical protein M0Q91_13355 [Methanoregula sp.]|jgi:DNA replication initiation complex subunit (GINS family)|nr:hypothetical protein [Methanoregula sp.]